jgi:predicted RNA-binding Zn-ribbon protein involved in translation (DUF1610 family)
MSVVLNVGTQNGQFVPLGYEHVATTINDVEFEKKDGYLVVSDIRVVWYKKPKSASGGMLKGFLKAAAVGAAGAAIGGELRSRGGFVGNIVGRGVQTATGATATAIAFDAMGRNQVVHRTPDGSAETMAIPLPTIKNATVEKDMLTITLTTGDQIVFKSSKAQMLSVAVAQIQTVKQQNNCSFCGAAIPQGSTHCPNCGAAVTVGTSRVAPAAPAGASAGPSSVSLNLGGIAPQMIQAQCPYCKQTVAVGRRCANCGKPLMVTCGKCKQEIPLWMYPQGRCPNCGERLF